MHEGKRLTVQLWDSELSAEDCNRDFGRRLNAVVKSMDGPREDFAAAAEGFKHKADSCSAGAMGDLAHGTEVRRAWLSGECGKMAKVTVLIGRQEGKVGCLWPGSLSDTRPE
jgi:hypothetical protein